MGWWEALQQTPPTEPASCRLVSAETGRCRGGRSGRSKEWAEREVVATEGSLRAARFHHHRLHRIAPNSDGIQRQAYTEGGGERLVVHLSRSNNRCLADERAVT